MNLSAKESLNFPCKKSLLKERNSPLNTHRLGLINILCETLCLKELSWHINPYTLNTFLRKYLRILISSYFWSRWCSRLLDNKTWSFLKFANFLNMISGNILLKLSLANFLLMIVITRCFEMQIYNRQDH